MFLKDLKCVCGGGGCGEKEQEDVGKCLNVSVWTGAGSVEQGREGSPEDQFLQPHNSAFDSSWPLPFKGNCDVDVAPGENEFDTPAIEIIETSGGMIAELRRNSLALIDSLNDWSYN